MPRCRWHATRAEHHQGCRVPGGTADTAGEKVSYVITVANTGNTTLTGVTVTDPYADAGSIVRGPDVVGRQRRPA
jgi:hypothetical protein